MDLEDAMNQVIAYVGRERFERACQVAWSTPDGTGGPRVPAEVLAGDDVAMVPHELADFLDAGKAYDPLPGADDVLRHRVALKLYRRLPAYGFLMYLPFVRTPEVLEVYGNALRELLDDEDPRIADPVAYHLWCGDFEAADQSAEWSWSVVTQGAQDHPRRLARVLANAGPVPWRLKRELYRDLVDVPEWREAVRHSIAQGRLDVFGQIDEQEAALWG